MKTESAISCLSGQPTISIVIPIYNGGESFRQCLDSLEEFAHGYFQVLEVIVVVDGGRDDSEALAQKFGATVLKLPQTGVPARARNQGAL